MGSLKQMSTFFSCILFILLLLERTLNTFAQDDFLYYNSTCTANHANSSTYNTNLNTTLSSISASSNIDQYGFYYSSIGQEPNSVTAVALCRGDIELELCRACVDHSIWKLIQVYPDEKEAIEWNSICMFMYTNQTIPFGTMEWVPGFSKWGDKLFVQNQYLNMVQELRRTLLLSLQDRAASGDARRKYASGDEQLQNYETAYSLLQCTPDLSKPACTECTHACMEFIPRCCNRNKGGAVYKPTCNLRYELGTDAFYNETSPSPQAPRHLPPSEYNTTRNIIIFVLSIVIFVLLVVYIFIYLRKRNLHFPIQTRLKANTNLWLQMSHEELQYFVEKIARVAQAYGFVGLTPQPKIQLQSGFSPQKGMRTLDSLQYDFATIKVATDNFSNTNKLGQGGFGYVYKGILPYGHEFAVKRLSEGSGQSESEFKYEVLVMSRLENMNLVKLLGFCLEGTERLLVYEFVVNGSLNHFIFDTIEGAKLDWGKRYKIIRGIAKGLLYLHEDCRGRIIHCYLKASNILLDAEMNAKIAGFGTARCFALDETQGSSSKIAGSYGYMAPEVMQGHISVKSDVYSFGVLVLEIVSGQKISKTFGDDEESLISYAWRMCNEGTANLIVASNLIEPTMKNNSGSMHEIMKCIHIGLLCVQENVAYRPTLASVVFLLSDFCPPLSIPTRPAFSLSNSSSSTLEMEMPLLEQQARNLSANEASITELNGQ